MLCFFYEDNILQETLLHRIFSSHLKAATSLDMYVLIRNPIGQYTFYMVFPECIVMSCMFYNLDMYNLDMVYNLE